jgi:hypothetical protein
MIVEQRGSAMGRRSDTRYRLVAVDGRRPGIIFFPSLDG